MKSISSIFLLLFLFHFTSCTDEFQLDKSQFESSLVIQGFFTDSGDPAEIYVTRSELPNTEHETYYYNYNRENFVKDATVILYSDKQAEDTLTLVDTDNDLYYQSHTIQGIANETYTLKVISENQIYEASCFMLKAPEMDSISFQRKQVSKENANLFVPMVNFQEPGEQKNYYLFNECSVYSDTLGKDHWNSIINNDPWNIAVFNDEFINGKYVSLNIHEGIPVAHYWRDGNFWLIPGDPVNIQMQAITKETYDYFQALINQLSYAAGVFHPAPASPPSNFSNGAQGFFRAAGVSRVRAVVPEEAVYDK